MKPLNLAEETETPLISKTKELCATILEQPGYVQMKQAILEFMHHDEARVLYENLCDMQEALHNQQDEGVPVAPEDEAEFRAAEQRFIAMPVAQAFIQAQRQMQTIEKTVSSYVRRTFELGRIPEAEDLGGGCGCGSSSCGC